ncbi:MAG: phage tail assembly protein [Anaerolineae bacterium]|nr:phage tail assembly protein [Anaerolineae bacterium]
MMQTDVEFFLPRGYVDEAGQVHQHGRMRLALAMDEVEAMNDARVRANESYLPVLLLSRVVTQIGLVTAVTPDLIAHLFASDLAYLQELYLRLNSGEHVAVGAVCPACHTAFRCRLRRWGDEE